VPWKVVTPLFSVEIFRYLQSSHYISCFIIDFANSDFTFEPGITVEYFDLSRQCGSTLLLPETLSAYRCPSDGCGSAEDFAVVTGGTKLAKPPYVWWQSSDLSLFEPSYASALASRLKIPFMPTGIPATRTGASTSARGASPGSMSTNLSAPTSAPSPD
jgi:hypothetical protein